MSGRTGLKGFFGEEIAGRAAEELGDFVDMVRIVFDVVFGAFDLPDETFRYTDSIRQHGLGDVLAFPLFTNSVDNILVDRVYHKLLVLSGKTKQLILWNACVYTIDTQLSLSALSED